MRMVPAQNTEPLKPSMLWSLGACAAVTLALGQVMRSRRLGPAFETLRIKPDDPEALVRWRQGVLISDVLAEATVLYGFAVHALGGPANAGRGGRHSRHRRYRRLPVPISAVVRAA